jgi:hypothetical protein
MLFFTIVGILVCSAVVVVAAIGLIIMGFDTGLTIHRKMKDRPKPARATSLIEKVDPNE